MTCKRIISLFTGIILVLCFAAPVMASDTFPIGVEHHYQGPDGSPVLDNSGYTPSGQMSVTRNVPTPLLRFVNTQYGGDDYNFISLQVIDADKNVVMDLERWQVNSGETFSFPNEDYWVYVYYNSDKLIRATAGTGGRIDTSDGSAIDPLGDVDVPPGADQGFDIVPDSGYHISDVLVDGVSMGAIESYTFSNVISGRTIHAAFAVDPPPVPVPDPVPDPAPTPIPLDLTPGPAPSGGNNSSSTYSVLYYMNIKDGEAPFYIQGSYYKYDTAIVTDRVPSREGYRFLYWTDNSIDHGRHHKAMDKLTIHRDYILYAQWELIPTTFQPESSVNDNPGTGAPQS